jgi:putative CocE/NonD family hydrolase
MGQCYQFYYDHGVYREAHVKMLEILGYGVSKRVREAPRPNRMWTFVKNLTFRPDMIEVPCLMITGWWDHFMDEIIETFEGIVEKGGPKARKHSKFLVGPWDHVSIGLAKQGDRTFEDAAKASAEAAKAFFDYWLLGKENGWEKTARVRYWQTNEPKWVEVESWSGIKRKTKTLYLSADGTIGEEPGEGDRSYTYDPKKPSPTLGGANLPPLRHGPTDHGRLDARKDVLAYSTGKLEEPLRINGNVKLSFEFTADRETCDFSARLCEVRDGKPYLIADAVCRVWDHEPGEKGRVTLHFPATAITVSELRIYLSSSNWPRYERNPHTGADHWERRGCKTLKATIHHGSAKLNIPEPGS